MEVVSREDLTESEKEDLEIIEEVTGPLSERELYIFRMAQHFVKLDGGDSNGN